MERSNSREMLRRMLLVICLALIGLCGCKDSSNSQTKNSGAAKADLRIISLSPAISRTLIDFGLHTKIVGRTPHCASIDEEIPAVGDLHNINYEQIVKLKPTHILVQPPEAGVDAHLTELAKQHHWTIGQWKLNDIDDVETLVRELPSVLFAEGSPEHVESSRDAAAILNSIAAALTPGEAPIFRGRTLLVYRVLPVNVFGEGTYLDDLLKAMGGTNATNAKGWVTLSLEDVARLNPEAIILVRPQGDPFNLTSQLGSLWELDIAAVLNRRVAMLTHPDAFTPSTGVIGVAEELRTILESFESR